MENKQKNILWFNEVTKKDVDLVGGKNGSAGRDVFAVGAKRRAGSQRIYHYQRGILALFEVQRH